MIVQWSDHLLLCWRIRRRGGIRWFCWWRGTKVIKLLCRFWWLIVPMEMHISIVEEYFLVYQALYNPVHTYSLHKKKVLTNGEGTLETNHSGLMKWIQEKTLKPIWARWMSDTSGHTITASGFGVCLSRFKTSFHATNFAPAAWMIWDHWFCSSIYLFLPIPTNNWRKRSVG